MEMVYGSDANDNEDINSLPHCGRNVKMAKKLLRNAKVSDMQSIECIYSCICEQLSIVIVAK